MDYFFWDEIFGGKQGLAESLLEEPRIETEDQPELISVIIAFVDNFQQGPKSS